MKDKKLDICVVTPNYPSSERSVYTFVAHLCEQLADMGHNIKIVSPQSINKSLVRKIALQPEYISYETHLKNKIEIYRPFSISTGNLKIINYDISLLLAKQAIKRCILKYNINPDVFYGHFWHYAYAIFNVAKDKNTPLFAASGESVIVIRKMIPFNKLRDFISYVSGVVCVSSKNKDESIRLGLVKSEKCIILPNGINPYKFHNKSKMQVRSKLGFSDKDFIIAFTGAFIERKGPLRLSKAILQINDNSIKSIFIGSGSQIPLCNGILFCGKLLHDEIVDYLNCADVFVLPTLHEGCSNAIIEAMACGLPIISSNRAFNDEILNEKYALRIDPLDINQIADAIIKIKDDKQLRIKMSKEALIAAKQFEIQKRSESIVSFIKMRI